MHVLGENLQSVPQAGERARQASIRFGAHDDASIENCVLHCEQGVPTTTSIGVAPRMTMSAKLQRTTTSTRLDGTWRTWLLTDAKCVEARSSVVAATA